MCENRPGSDDLHRDIACFAVGSSIANSQAEKLIHADAPKVRAISAHNLSAWHKHLRAYRPNIAGNITYNGGGLRTAWRAPA